jgi:hypothetical protein
MCTTDNVAIWSQWSPEHEGHDLVAVDDLCRTKLKELYGIEFLARHSLTRVENVELEVNQLIFDIIQFYHSLENHSLV